MNLLITGAWNGAKEHISEIEALGHSVVFMQQEAEALPCDPMWVEGVIGNGLFLSHEIEQFENLRYIQLTSAGYDRVPMDYVRKNGIEIHNARGVYSIPMAEFALCGVMSLLGRMLAFAKSAAAHRWEKQRGVRELFGKTVAIVGCGNVGTECAKRFSAMGCRVLGVDLYPREDACYESILPLEQLYEALKEADAVVLTLPYTGETHHLMDAEALLQMKQGAILVNIARGGVVDTKALITALTDGRLGGAVLDVFEEEPLSEDSPLWELENVIVTPHNSFVGDGNAERLLRVILKNLSER